MDEAQVLAELNRRLAELEGTKIKRGKRRVARSGEKIATEPSIVFERLVGDLLRDIAVDPKVVRKEPIQAGQYPDWALGDLYFEVKSSKSSSKSFPVGAVKKMAEAFNGGDPKYLTAHYVVFYHTLLSKNYLRIDGAEAGKIWDYSKPTAGKSGRRPHWPSSRQPAGSVGVWSNLYLEHTANRGYPVSLDSFKKALLSADYGDVALAPKLPIAPTVSFTDHLHEDDFLATEVGFTPQEAVGMLKRQRKHRNSTSVRIRGLKRPSRKNVRRLITSLESLDSRVEIFRMVRSKKDSQIYHQLDYVGDPKRFLTDRPWNELDQDIFVKFCFEDGQ